MFFAAQDNLLGTQRLQKMNPSSWGFNATYLEGLTLVQIVSLVANFNDSTEFYETALGSRFSTDNFFIIQYAAYRIN